MADNNLSLSEQISEIKAEIAAQMEEIRETLPGLYAEYKCSEALADEFRENIAQAYHQCKPGEIPVVTARIEAVEQESIKIEFGIGLWANLSEVIDPAMFAMLEEQKALSAQLPMPEIPVFFQWVRSPQVLDFLGVEVLNCPRQHVRFIPTPFCWENPFKRTVKTKPVAKPTKLEKDLEKDLLEWLHAHGVKADNQVSTNKRRVDIWIPGQCFLELKRDKVTGDDVCQAIDYCNEYKKPVVLVGNHVSTMASRGISAFNKAVDGEMVVFVSWSGIKTYLKGLMHLS